MLKQTNKQTLPNTFHYQRREMTETQKGGDLKVKNKLETVAKPRKNNKAEYGGPVVNCSRHILSSASHSEAGRVVSSSLTDEEVSSGSAETTVWA